MVLHSTLNQLEPILGRDFSINRITTALTNACYHICTPNQHYALRINHPQSTRFGIDRTRERALLTDLKGQSSVLPVVSFLDAGLLSPWFESIDLELPLSECVDIFAHIHSIPVITSNQPRWTPLFVDAQISLLLHHQLTPIGENLVSNINQVLQEYERPEVLTLCYHDWHAGNLIRSEKGLILLDWEYAAPGDIAIDLACFSEGFDLQDDFSFELCERFGVSFERFKQAKQLTRLMSVLWYGARFIDANTNTRLRHLIS